MKIVPLNQTQAAEVAQLQANFKQAQAQHVASYKALLSRLQQITGVQAEQGRKTRLAVSDDGTSIVVM